MIAIIGNKDVWLSVGKNASFIATTSGFLQLMINDSEPDSGAGCYQVNVQVEKAQK